MPHPDQIKESNLTRFGDWLRENRSLNLQNHGALYDWSIRDLEGFWSAVVEFFDVRFHMSPECVLRLDVDPTQTKWFPGGTINYAEHLLRFGQDGTGLSEDRPAVIYCAEPGVLGNRQVLNRKELLIRVSQMASALKRLGVQPGDRVAGYLPNRIETLIAFLATVSQGAIWSNCPPELSSRGVVDRLAQIEPKVLVAVAGYRYAGKNHDRATALAEIAANLPSLCHVIVVEAATEVEAPKLRSGNRVYRWSDLLVRRPPECPFISTRCRLIIRSGFFIPREQRGCPSRSSTATAAYF